MPINEDAITKAIKVFDLTSPERIAEQGGTITGSPTFDKDKGAYFDGTNDYITYAIPGTLLNKSEISFIVECTPGFDSSETGSIRYLFSTTSDDWVLRKRTTAENFYTIVSGTVISAFPFGSFSSGEKQQFTLAYKSGNNEAYWNTGSTTKTSGNSTAFTPDTTDVQFFVGANSSGTEKYIGWIKSISIINYQVSGDEAVDYFKGSTFNFQNKADIYLDMKSRLNDGSNDTTKDKSGNGNDFLIGDGSTAATQPTFNNPGYDFDGSTDYLLNSSATGVYNNAEQSIVMCFRPDFDWTVDARKWFYSSTAGARYYAAHMEIATYARSLRIFMAETVIADIATSVYSPYWNTHGLNVLVVAGTSGNTDVWLNGFKILDADNTAWSPDNPSDIYVGSENTPSNYFDGEIFHFSTYPIKMTSIQMRKITQELMTEYSN